MRHGAEILSNDLERMPWEAQEGEPLSGVGICLSGGGLRSASFCLGVVQTLQSTKGLLFGPAAARYLAVVSGGSYLGAAFTINAAAAASGETPPLPAPLAASSPEEAHLLQHGRYLVEEGRFALALRFGLRALVNMAGLVILFVWAGFILADVAAILAYLLPELVAHLVRLPATILWLVAGVSLIGLRTLLRAAYRLRTFPDEVWLLLGLLLFAAGSPALLDRAMTLPLLSAPDVWTELRAGWWLIAAGITFVLGLSTALAYRKPRAIVTRVLGVVAVNVPRIVGLILLFQIASAMTRLIGPVFRGGEAKGSDLKTGIIIVITLIGPLLASPVVGRTSLHRIYRDLLARCFAVKRRPGRVQTIVPTTSQSLSGLAPPSAGGETSFPRLLICATANVRRKRSGPGWERFAQFVFSHDHCGLAGIPNASMPTEKLELLRVLGGFMSGREPGLSLMGAVATTGAAISPSMGRMTMPAIRPFMAALNLRLGAWYPNPMSQSIRKQVRERVTPGKLKVPVFLGSGFDDLVPEMLGLQDRRSARVYVSDGGHFDNLGLLALLRARCEEIWCVDADADATGSGKTLRQVLAIACEDLGVRHNLDLDSLGLDEGGYTGSHLHGELSYADGATATLHVIKLAWSKAADTPTLARYRLFDRRFPFHSTVVQWYGSGRFTAYESLGQIIAREAILSSPST